MADTLTTKDILLIQGRRLFWARGYSNVSVREIARAAEVDVALISRYYGSKLKLYEATLVDVPEIDACHFPDAQTLVDRITLIFVTANRDSSEPSPLRLFLMNAQDAEVGEMTRACFQSKWQNPLEQIIGDAGKAAQFSAVMFGFSVAEKSLNLPGIPDHTTPEYEQRFRYLLQSALAGPEI
ncbi:Bacterial regulatory proteins, tetR family [Roseovarius albus]|uniref:Bacterial regulatory proteins, tetR family n=1 Tax=Roseovarius albus TaxID=1247867 RepID=A0A1X7A373_9RHOB|nr:TetR/AcrR family transcriptional regulator [Roseovarius albus]SLN69191.1 Bacterial regulatory proteins, tetR family [Roseovarius albus]